MDLEEQEDLGTKMRKKIIGITPAAKLGSDGKADSTHYGGADNPHETIKCLHAWGLEDDALLWTTGKYLSRAGKKSGATLIRDLEKAHYYLGKKIERLKEEALREETLTIAATAAFMGAATCRKSKKK